MELRPPGRRAPRGLLGLVLLGLVVLRVATEPAQPPRVPEAAPSAARASPATGPAGAASEMARGPGGDGAETGREAVGPTEGPSAGMPGMGPAPAASSPAEWIGGHGEGTARTWRNRDGPPGGTSLDVRDLRVLAALVDANGLDESSSAWDYDDGNGVLEPHEVGFQVWRDGRLVALSTGEDRYGSFGYEIAVLPPALGDLDALEELDLQTNRIAALPESLGALSRLRVLRLHRNALEALPASIGSLAALEELSLGENALSELPPDIGALGALEELQLNDNPLRTLPDPVGSLARLRVLNVSHGRPVDPARAAADSVRPVAVEARLQELPPTIERLDRLETLHLAGNRLFCAGGHADPGLAPLRLRDGSIPRLHGLVAQDCGGSASP